MSIIKNVTLQKIVAHNFRYDPRINGSYFNRILTKFRFSPTNFHNTPQYETGILDDTWGETRKDGRSDMTNLVGACSE